MQKEKLEIETPDDTVPSWLRQIQQEYKERYRRDRP
jgi:hypothetical protein